MSSTCPCGSGMNYKSCCEPLHLGKKNASTAEQLMRSRYCAFAKVQVDYLIDTHHKSTRNTVSKASILDWAKTTQWTNLEIVSTQKGLENDLTGVVEFRAFYLYKGKKEIHHEISNFIKEENKWYYVDGEFE